MAAMAQQSLQEADLVRRVQTGDDGAFDRLVELCSAQVYSLAYRLIGNNEDAQDLAQEAFVRVYQAIPRFRHDATFSTWLYRIVVNVCHDELARRRRRPSTMTELSGDDETSTQILDTMSAGGETPETLLLRRERQRALQHALLQLPEAYRMVVLLHDVQGLAYQEIAEVLHTGVGTVKSRLHRARLMLREKISNERELFALEVSQSQ